MEILLEFLLFIKRSSTCASFVVFTFVSSGRIYHLLRQIKSQDVRAEQSKLTCFFGEKSKEIRTKVCLFVAVLGWLWLILVSGRNLVVLAAPCFTFPGYSFLFDENHPSIIISVECSSPPW